MGRPIHVVLVLAGAIAVAACGPTELEHYRGAIHEHSGYSDGVPGSIPATYYAAGAAAGLDFVGSAEHSDSEDVPIVFSEACLGVPDIAGCAIADPGSPVNSFRKWEATQEQAAAATAPDFTAFRGFEWTSDRFGHINVYFSRQSVNAKIDGGYAAMDAFWSWFTRRPGEGGGGDGLATFNHPDDKKLSDLDPQKNWNDFAYVPAADDRMVGIELFNGGSRHYESWYVRALDRGWHVGAVGAEDSHGPSWATPDLAKTVLIARDRSPGALYEAMYARRMYAQLGADAHIELLAGGGAQMGARIGRPLGASVPIGASVSIAGGAPTRIDLVSNGGTVVASAPGSMLVYYATATADERWYFVRVTVPVDGTDQVVAYSSPIWISATRRPPRGHWVAGDLHVHTTYSHDSYGGPDDDNTGPDEFYTLGHSVTNQFIIGAVRGLDYLAITDHNDIRSQSDLGFASQGLIGLPSYENSLQGHAQMHGATRLYDNGDSSIARVRALANELRADGGVFQINHPAGESVNFPEDADWKYFRSSGYEGDVVPDVVEILNINSLFQPPLPSSNSIDDAIRYWEGWLDRGAHVGATGGSDNHWVSTTAAQGAGQPTTWVFVSERSARGVLEGLRRGRTTISWQPPAHAGPRVFLEADAERDGVFEAMVGDVVRAGARYRVTVEGGTGMLLDLVSNGGQRIGMPLPVAGAPYTYEFDLPAAATWVRAELYTPDLDAQRAAACDGLVGEQSTLCRNRLAIAGLTSAIYQRP
jgi:hypothetical protein